MGVDHAGHQDETAAVDRRHAGRCKAGTHIDDRTILHANVAVGQIGFARHHGDHIGVADHYIAAARQRCD